MKIIVRSIAVAATWDDGKLVDQPSFREVTFRALDLCGTSSRGLAVPIESTITLPIEECQSFQPGVVFDVILARLP